MDHDLECEEEYLRGEKDQWEAKTDRRTMTDKTIDVQTDAPTQALTVREAMQAVEPAKPDSKPQMTAAQAKIDAISNLTQTCYARASELKLTPEESAALQAPFPDEAFRTGAAGKEELIYLEHFALRERLNNVLGLGQWTIVPRARWAEDYQYYDKQSRSYQTATRVYVEAMLVIRGCFVSESIGDMTYYPKNQSTNYGDAVEGAQSEALRRCCKNFGIGLQAWSKAFQDGWWQRKRAGNKPPTAPPAPRTAPAAAPKQEQASAQQSDNDKFCPIYPAVTVIAVKEVHSKPDAPKAWTAYFIRFSDGFGELEAATFDRKIADFANDLANTGENATLRVKPGKKPNTKEIVSLERADMPPDAPQGELPMDDDVPMDVNP